MLLTAIVLAKNEKDKIASCIDSLSFANEVILIDDSSTDETVNIAKKHGARIVEYKEEDSFAEKRNFGLEQASGEWILFVDADELVSASLQNEIVRAIKDTKVAGYYLLRSDTIWGHTMRFGESAKYPLLRLARKSAGQFVGSVHEVWKVRGKKRYLSQVLHHSPHQSVEAFLTEINNYSNLRALELFVEGKQAAFFSIGLYTIGKFIQNYFLKLGILDRMPGLVSAIMMSFYSFQVRAKLWQLKKSELKHQ